MISQVICKYLTDALINSLPRFIHSFIRLFAHSFIRRQLDLRAWLITQTHTHALYTYTHTCFGTYKNNNTLFLILGAHLMLHHNVRVEAVRCWEGAGPSRGRGKSIARFSPGSSSSSRHSRLESRLIQLG